MIEAAHTCRHVFVKNVAVLDNFLNAAVEAIIPNALALRQGIRVTRVGPGNYIVETASDVQCGYTIYDDRSNKYPDSSASDSNIKPPSTGQPNYRTTEE